MSSPVQFLRIYFQNFKATKEAEIDIRKPGLTLLYGANGAGKSTYADAFYFALRGRTVHGDGGSDVLSLIHLGDALVELEFKACNKVYLVRRIITRKGIKTAEVFENGTKSGFATVHELNAFLKTICSDAELFNSVLFNKTSKAFFPLLADSQKRKFFENMVGAAVYDIAEKLIDSELTELERHLESNEDEVKRFAAQAEQKKVSHSELIIHTNKQITDFEAIIKEKTDLILDINNWIVESQRSKTQQETLELKRTEASTCVFNTESEILALRKQKENTESRIRSEFILKRNTLLLEIAALQKQILEIQERTHSEQLNAFKVVQLQLEEELKSIDLDETTTQKEFKSKREVSIRNQKAADENRIELIKYLEKLKLVGESRTKEIEQITKSITDATTQPEIICPTCGESTTNLDKLKHKLQSLEAEVTEVESNIRETNSKLAKQTELLQAHVEASKVLDQELENIQARFQPKRLTAAKDAEKRKEEYSANSVEKSKIEQTKLEKLCKDKSFAVEILQKEEDNTVLENPENRRISSKLSEIELILKDYRQQYESCSTEIAKLEAAYGISMLRNKEEVKLAALNDIEVLKKQIQDAIIVVEKNEKCTLEWTKENTERLQDEKLRLQHQGKIVAFWKKGFGNQGIKKHFLAEILPDLNNRLAKQSNILANGVIHVSVALEGKKLVFKTKHTVKKSEYSSFSSGEKAIVALIFVLAASEMLQAFGAFGANFAIFDEVFDALDNYNSSLVFEALGKLAEKKRVILITHSPFMKGSDLIDESIEVQ